MLKKILTLLIFSIISLTLFADREDFLFLHSASLNFKKGIPAVRVLMQEEKESKAIVKGDFTITCEDKTLKATAVEITVTDFKSAEITYKIALEEIDITEMKNYQSYIEKWNRKLKDKTEIFTDGAIFSIKGKKVDNRNYYVTLKNEYNIETATEKAAKLREEFPEALIKIKENLMEPNKSRIKAATKKEKIECSDIIFIKSKGKIIFQSQTYNIEDSDLFITATEKGTIALGGEFDVESLLYRILPGEMFLSAPLETLKAQAVAARTDIFTQIGKRHVTEPWHICSEVHCQKIAWETPLVQKKFMEAVDQTKGEILLYNGNNIARAPYSSSCGGHTENIKNVWFEAEKPFLKGIYDGNFTKRDLTKEKNVKLFLEEIDSNCNIKINRKLRWTKNISTKKMNHYMNDLSIGEIVDLTPVKRGVSGRIYILQVTGTKGSKRIYGELNIRRHLGNLYSSLFIVTKVNGVWQLRGGGWGHGVGMCQMGAIGMGSKGKTHYEILKFYYPGIEINKAYE